MRSISQQQDWIDRVIYDSRLTAEVLIRKKVAFMWTLVSAICVVVLTVLAYFTNMIQLYWYGVVLTVMYIIFFPILLRSFHFERHNAIFLSLVILSTFGAILSLGGISHSMGLEFVGLTCAMASVIWNRAKWTVFLFSLFGLTILLSSLLQPFLEVPGNVSPFNENLFVTINTLWMSGSILNFILTYIREKSEFESERSERLLELNKIKSRLYTNITHEFRTPITLILGMADQILKNPAQKLQENVQVIIRNGKNLLRLVNQMLDLQKAEAGVLQHSPSQQDVISFLSYVCHSFRHYAESQGLTLKFSSPVQSLQMDIDTDKLMVVMSNLLSNAIKFTPGGGAIHVTAKLENGLPETFSISVADTGTGIGQDYLPHIFDRFFQPPDATSRHMGGTGIGLSLTKELVQLMGGKIQVSSKEGQSTRFTINLPVTRNAPIVTGEEDSWSSELSLHLPGVAIDPPEDDLSVENDLPLLLLVEDNKEMLHYLATLLRSEYRLIIARNGLEGLEKARGMVPDMILTDVMMPEMDGNTLCLKLKSDLRTSHIPVVMLTAKADAASRIEGLASGADAYLTKPFLKAELDVQLKKLIELRQQLQRRYTMMGYSSPSPDPVLAKEDSFMEKVREILEKHIADEAFGITQLCHELAMSRAQLYRKFQALTAVPIGTYIRKFRLGKARALLQTGKMNVTEAALESGFKNLSHFSSAFKDEFGQPPSEVYFETNQKNVETLSEEK